MWQFFILSTFYTLVLCQDLESCDSRIFCRGKLLDTVQMARLFDDSKIFVDMKMKTNEDEILANFEALLERTNQNPSREEVKNFVDDNFEEFKVFDDWTPTDYTSNPELLHRIEDKKIRDFAQDIVKIWPDLAKTVRAEVKQSPELFSLIPVEHGFIIPGGRFREFYYWDTYWIVRGLLLSDMHQTVRGMLENFFHLVERYGFIPNGARIYYLNRSQPPLLTLMMASYFHASKDVKFLKRNIKTLDKELQFWLRNRTVSVGTYVLAHYASESGTPRPESYYEDVETAQVLVDDKQKKRLFADLKSAAESGWDFSSRWIIDDDGGNQGNLTNAKTSRIIPVDLNAFLAQAFTLISGFYKILGDAQNSAYWAEKATVWSHAIREILYHQDDGVWYDYDLQLKRARKFFYPSNLTPLWTRTYPLTDSQDFGQKAVNYLRNEGILEFEGGVPTSLTNSGQQWDLPGAWAPLQHIVIYGLHQSGNREAKDVARMLAEKWLESTFDSYRRNHEMYEKYDALHAGEPGGGGEYMVQTGFGWTNGLDLVLINDFYASNK